MDGFKKKNLNYMPKSTHRVICNRTFFFKNRDIKLGTVNYLPLGAKVSVIDIDKEWAKIILPENNDYKYRLYSN